MLEELKDIFSKASSKGDVAVVLIAGTTGFLIDAGLNAVGFLEPGAVGITFASGALGVKRAIEAVTEKARARKLEKQMQLLERREIEQKIEQLKGVLEKLPTGNDEQALYADLDLYTRGLLSKEEVETSISRIVEKLRNRNAQ